MDKQSADEWLDLMASEYIRGLKDGQSMASDYAQYDDEDWEREKQKRIKWYEEYFSEGK